MRLSVPMIVKNAGVRLRACLESVRPIADEIIVLDTGSTDDTLNIAASLADRVQCSSRFNSCTAADAFHFAEARNEVLALCTGDWILSIDADETLHQDGLRDFLSATEYDFCLIPMRLKQRPGHVASVPRLWRHGHGVQWVGRYHDVPSPWDDGRQIILPESLCLLDNSGGNERDKILRNLMLLKRQMIEEGVIRPTVMQIGDTYRALGVSHYGEAIGYLELCLSTFGAKSESCRPYLLFALSDCYSRCGAMRKAITYATDLISEYPRYARGHLVLAETYERLKQYDLAIGYYQRALAINDPMPLHPYIDEPIDRDAVQNRVMLCDVQIRKMEDETCH